jgi:hypothetical protein
VALTAALVVLGYYELPDEEQPDATIWGHPERLEEWFKAIKQRRESGMEPINYDEEPDDGFTRNELTAELLGE